MLVICARSQILFGLQVLEGLSLTPDQFVDLCILCGCDYCGTIKGISLSILLCIVMRARLQSASSAQ